MLGRTDVPLPVGRVVVLGRAAALLELLPVLLLTEGRVVTEVMLLRSPLEDILPVVAEPGLDVDGAEGLTVPLFLPPDLWSR